MGGAREGGEVLVMGIGIFFFMAGVGVCCFFFFLLGSGRV